MSLLPLKISKSVSAALSQGKAVLALESTVVTHGLPYPQNFAALAMLEELATAESVVPATIAIIEGQCCIGLEDEDILKLKALFQDSRHAAPQKISIRDIALAISKGYTGGTTVSATMYLAHQAGIKVFATGGIGGVHRGWQDTLDISSDLDALAKIPVIVVCAGSKAILDIAATLEMLEARSVPVFAWQSTEYPTFYSRTSGFCVPRIDNARELAQIYHISRSTAALSTGIMLANPIPDEDEIPCAEIEPSIKAAVDEARQKGIGGKELTPFLLSALAESTSGRSIKANLALLRNNVKVGALVAKELV